MKKKKINLDRTIQNLKDTFTKLIQEMKNFWKKNTWKFLLDNKTMGK